MADRKFRNIDLKSIDYDWDEINQRTGLYRKRVFRRIVLIVIAAVLVFCVCFLLSQLVSFNGYKERDTLSQANSVASHFENFEGNILKYSNDGAYYMDAQGNMIWNQTFEMNQPMVEICEGFAAFADQDGKDILIMDTTGLQGTIETGMEIKEISVANQGTVAVLMEQDSVSYLALYDRDGRQLAQGALHMENSGYPLDIALSNDAKKLCVSILDVGDGTVKSLIAFYNFGSVGQNEIDNLIASYSYEDTVVPIVKFLDNDKMIAFADNSVMIFEGSQKPDLKKSMEVDKEVKSVFCEDRHFGLVFSGEETLYEVELYDMSLSKRRTIETDFDYDEIFMMKNGEICMRSDTECAIYNLLGREKFRYDFEQDICGVFPETGLFRYTFVLEDEWQRARLTLRKAR